MVEEAACSAATAFGKRAAVLVVHLDKCGLKVMTHTLSSHMPLGLTPRSSLSSLFTLLSPLPALVTLLSLHSPLSSTCTRHSPLPALSSLLYLPSSLSSLFTLLSPLPALVTLHCHWLGSPVIPHHFSSHPHPHPHPPTPSPSSALTRRQRRELEQKLSRTERHRDMHRSQVIAIAEQIADQTNQVQLSSPPDVRAAV